MKTVEELEEELDEIQAELRHHEDQVERLRKLELETGSKIINLLLKR